METQGAVEVYARRPEHAPDQPMWSCGTGYLLGGRLVLTAAHVVCSADEAAKTVRVRVGPDLVAAEVAWHRPAYECDVALLVVTEPRWVAPPTRHPVRWGRLVTSRADQEWVAVGFPSVVAEPTRRDTHQAVGVFSPGSMLKAGRYAMEVTNPPEVPSTGGSAWAGMSGAAVRSLGLVVGVVTADPAGFGSRRLLAVPVAAFAEHPAFRRLVTEHCGRPPVVEPAELAGLMEPVMIPASPAGLLRADAECTPFRPRPELDRLHEWCQADSRSSTRLVVGPSGQGKTRLARRLMTPLAEAGWSSVMLSERADAHDLEVLNSIAVPTLVVIDYAETRLHQLAAVFEALTNAEVKVRLLLLARAAGAWRTERVAPSPRLGLLADDRIVLELGPLEPTPEGRAHAWDEAAHSFAARLGELDDYRAIDWPALVTRMDQPRLDGQRYRTILAVQMHALAELLRLGAPIADSGDQPEQVLLAHERRYWRRTADRFGVPLTPANQGYLVAAATLWGSTDEDEALRLVGQTQLTADRNAASNIADWLSTLYGDEKRYWSGLQPDALAEYLAGTDARLPALVTQTAAACSSWQLEHGLTLLGRAQPRHPHISSTVMDLVWRAGKAGGVAAIAVAPRLEEPRPLIAALDVLVRGSAPATLDDLYCALPEHSLVLADTGLRIAEALVAHYRDAARADPDVQLPELARWLHNLAVMRTTVGQRAESLAAAQDAVTFLRRLVTTDREAHLPLLASAVSTLSISLSELGRRAEGLATASEAGDLFQEIAANDRHAWPELIGPMNNLAIRLREAGHPAEALPLSQLTVAIRRLLAEIDRVLPDLAMSMSNLAGNLAEVGRRPEALAAAAEAVALNRELVERNRDGYLPGLAISVGNLASALIDMGRYAESLSAAREAVQLERELTGVNRAAYLPKLARALHRCSVALGETGQRVAALTTAQEAVALFRELVEDVRDAHLPDLTMSVSNLAIRLGQLARLDEAAAAASEAAELSRELVGLHRNAHLSTLAMAMNNQSLALGEIGQTHEALKAAREAIRLHRELVGLNRPRYLPDLVRPLVNLSNALSRTGNHHECLSVAQEAVALARELVREDRTAYLPLLTYGLSILSVRFVELNRRDDGIAGTREAVESCRELVDESPHHLPVLIAGLANLGAQLIGAGERADGLAATRESVGLCRTLLTENRDDNLPMLAPIVVGIAMLLENEGEHTEALDICRELTSRYQGLAAAEPAEYASRAVELANLVTFLESISSTDGSSARGFDLETLDRVVEQYRGMVATDRATYLPALALAVSALSVGLREAGDQARALSAQQETVGLGRELVTLNREAHLPGLAASVYNLGNALRDEGQARESLSTMREAVELYRELALADRAAHLDGLADSTYNLAATLIEIEPGHKAAAAAAEAAELWRELTAVDRAAHLPTLADALRMLGATLYRMGQRDEALTVIRETAAHYQELARSDPEKFGPLAKDADDMIADLESGGPDHGSDAVSPALKTIADLLEMLLEDGLRPELATLTPLLPGTLNQALEERRACLAIDWLIRTWLPTWLDLRVIWRHRASALRTLEPIEDRTALERAATAVRYVLQQGNLDAYINRRVFDPAPDKAEAANRAIAEDAASAAASRVAPDVFRSYPAPLPPAVRDMWTTGSEAAHEATHHGVNAGVLPAVRAARQAWDATWLATRSSTQAARDARDAAVATIHRARPSRNLWASRPADPPSRRRASAWTTGRDRVRQIGLPVAEREDAIYMAALDAAREYLAPARTELQRSALDLLRKLIDIPR